MNKKDENNKKDSSAYEEYFKDGVPDWDEREDEFNEDDDTDVEVDDAKSKKSSSRPKDDFISGMNLNKNKYNRDNLNTEERKKL